MGSGGVEKGNRGRRQLRAQKSFLLTEDCYRDASCCCCLLSILLTMTIMVLKVLPERNISVCFLTDEEEGQLLGRCKHSRDPSSFASISAALPSLALTIRQITIATYLPLLRDLGWALTPGTLRSQVGVGIFCPSSSSNFACAV